MNVWENGLVDLGQKELELDTNWNGNGTHFSDGGGADVHDGSEEGEH